METLVVAICAVIISFFYAGVGTILNLFGFRIHQFKPLIYSLAFLIIAFVRYQTH